MAYRKGHVAVAELLRLKGDDAQSGPCGILQGMLDGLRDHLAMDVAYLAEFRGDRRVFRFVSRSAAAPEIAVGESVSWSDSVCFQVVEGRLPELIRDAAEVPSIGDLTLVEKYGIGAHLCVPVTLGDGTLFGAMGCFSTRPDRSINRRNLEVLRMGARLAADLIERKRKSEAHHEALCARISSTIERGAFNVVYQPIFSISEGRAIGVEALTRFPDAGTRPPSAWFDEADEVGCTVELELATIRRAVEGLALLPEDVYLSVNVSLETLLSGKLLEVLQDTDKNRIVIELTEHEAVEDYEALKAALETLGKRARLAIDDVGAGYSSMRHILDLGPDFIKLDISIVRDLHRQPSRSAFVRAMVEFAKVANSSIVAEGVENQEELDELAKLDAANAQGYHLCRPLPLAQILPCLAGKEQSSSEVSGRRYG